MGGAGSLDSTVTVIESKTLFSSVPIDAVITQVPGAIAVISPDAFTVATAGFDEVKVSAETLAFCPLAFPYKKALAERRNANTP